MTERVADLAATETPLRCPGCGYDVRFASDSRCSECGKVFDRERLERTWWPWVHRREMGRVRAFFKTMAAVMFLPFRARDQVFGVLTLGDAWRFWWWCGVAAMPVWMAGQLVLWRVWRNSDWRAITMLESDLRHSGVLGSLLGIGVRAPGVMMLAIVVGLYLRATLVKGFFQSRGIAAEESRAAAAAMGVYQAAFSPVMWWLMLPVMIGPWFGMAVQRGTVWPGLLVVALTYYGWSLFCVVRSYMMVTGKRWRTSPGAIMAFILVQVAAVPLVVTVVLAGAGLVWVMGESLLR